MPEMKWYVVHTYSGYEQKAQKNLLENIRRMRLEDFFGEILVPTEQVVESTGKEKRTTTRKFFPGYIIVEMALTERTWHCIKDTDRVTGFVGNATNPPPVPDHEIQRLKAQMVEGTSRPKPVIAYEEGETVRVTDGPFGGFSGVVEEVKPDKGRVVVSVSIFGRATPIELDFSQLEKE